MHRVDRSHKPISTIEKLSQRFPGLHEVNQGDGFQAGTQRSAGFFGLKQFDVQMKSLIRSPYMTPTYDGAGRFAERVFQYAGIYGLFALLPQYVMGEVVGGHSRTNLAQPEHFYGFIGVALAWQFAFLVMSTDVRRYRLLMLPAIAEKLLFALPALILFADGRLVPMAAAAAGVDLLLALLFAIAFVRTRP